MNILRKKLSLWSLLFLVITNIASAKNNSNTMPTKVQGQVTEYRLPWANPNTASTHELIFNPQGGKYAWVTGQDYDMLAKINIETGSVETYKMPTGSGPHGVAFNDNGDFWVSLEFAGLVVKIDPANGKILEKIDVRIKIEDSDNYINPAPHAIEFAANGKTIWFTGKRTSTVGKISENGKVSHYQLPSLGAVPIYLVAGADGSMWGTELATSKILKVTNEGVVTEYNIPSSSSRPIAIIQAPDKKSFWFSQEASHKVGKIDLQGNITEYPVPQVNSNMLLAGLAFDGNGNLWTQSYTAQSDSFKDYSSGSDYIIKLSRDILTAPANNITNVVVSFYPVPTERAIFHRIKLGSDGNIWFTELGQDQIGKVAQ